MKTPQMKILLKIRTLWKREQGSEVIEFGLVLFPMFGLLFILVDLSWMLFARATLQFAAREAVRYAVTGQTGAQGQDAAIESVVVADSMGFATTANVTIQYWANVNGVMTATQSNAGGNVVQVTVSGVNVSPIAPFLHAATPITMSATSSDVVEPSPNGVAPTR
jgi:Flp pilus assembly protein TadG